MSYQAHQQLPETHITLTQSCRDAPAGGGVGTLLRSWSQLFVGRLCAESRRYAYALLAATNSVAPRCAGMPRRGLSAARVSQTPEPQGASPRLRSRHNAQANDQEPVASARRLKFSERQAE